MALENVGMETYRHFLFLLCFKKFSPLAVKQSGGDSVL